jgi:hypothetical protein
MFSFERKYMILLISSSDGVELHNITRGKKNYMGMDLEVGLAKSCLFSCFVLTFSFNVNLDRVQDTCFID